MFFWKNKTFKSILESAGSRLVPAYLTLCALWLSLSVTSTGLSFCKTLAGDKQTHHENGICAKAEKIGGFLPKQIRNTLSLVPLFSAISADISGIISFILLIPILIYQQEDSRSTALELKEAIEGLKRVPSIDAGLEIIHKWMEDESTEEIIYLSRLSAIPGFWALGSRWNKSLWLTTLRTRVRRGAVPHVTLVGPSPTSSMCMRGADMLWQSMENGTASISVIEPWESAVGCGEDICRLHQNAIDLVNRENYILSNNRSAQDSLGQNKIQVITVDSEAISKILVNFAVRIKKGESFLSKWNILFFDFDERILQSTADLASAGSRNSTTGYEERSELEKHEIEGLLLLNRLLNRPSTSIFSSNNALLGAMFLQVYKDIILEN